jgi:hypothetical protein
VTNYGFHFLIQAQSRKQTCDSFAEGWHLDKNLRRPTEELRALIVKHDADKRTVNVHATAVVFNEAQVPEPIHKETHSGAGCADHFGKGLLTHFRDERYRLGFLSKVGQQQEKSSEAFFAGVEEVIHQVRFHANIPGKHVGEKGCGKFRFLMEQAHHYPLLHPNDGAPFDCASGGHAKRLARQTALAKEATFRQDGNDGFFATLGYSREFHLAALEVENRIRRVPLRKDGFITLVLLAAFS